MTIPISTDHITISLGVEVCDTIETTSLSAQTMRRAGARVGGGVAWRLHPTGRCYRPAAQRRRQNVTQPMAAPTPRAKLDGSGTGAATNAIASGPLNDGLLAKDGLTGARVVASYSPIRPEKELATNR